MPEIKRKDDYPLAGSLKRFKNLCVWAKMSNFASVFSNEGHAVEIAFRQEYEPSSITNEVMKRIVLFLIGLSACV